MELLTFLSIFIGLAVGVYTWGYDKVLSAIGFTVSVMSIWGLFLVEAGQISVYKNAVKHGKAELVLDENNNVTYRWVGENKD